MDKAKSILLVLVSVILALIVPFIILFSYLSNPGHFSSFHTLFDLLMRKDPYVPVRTFFALINIGLIVPLFYIYVKIYRRMPNQFTLGLLLVILSLLLYAITAGPFMTHLLGLHSFNEGPFQFLPSLFATIALIVLVKISLE